MAHAFHDGWDQLIGRKAGGPCEPPALEITFVLAFVVLDRFLDFLFHRIEVERSRILHRRVVDRRHSEFCDLLLDQDEAPKLAGIEIVPVAEGAVVRGLAADRRRPLKRVLSDIDQ